MSLQEFFSDESYGGSWADEEFDMASISVPIEKNRNYGHGSDNRYGGGFGGSRGDFGKPVDNGPPYIVKLSNIPLTSDDRFIEDLFQSRFTPLVKFKIIFDPSSHPLESGIVKKIAFVELRSFADQSKVSRWQDVVFKGTRRINIELADFQDFQFCMGFNQDNQERLLQVEQEFLSARPRQGNFDDRPLGGNRFHPNGRAPGGMPLDNIMPNRRVDHRGPPNGFPNRSNPPSEPPTQTTANPPLQSKPKHNPFGNAKPVDVIAKEHEMETTYVHEHHSLPPQLRRKSSSSSAQRPSFQDLHKNDHSRSSAAQGSEKPQGAKPSEESITKKKTFADVLSAPKDREPIKQTGKISGSNASAVRKPVILKKKPVSSPEVETKKPEMTTGQVEETAKTTSGVDEATTTTTAAAAAAAQKTENEPVISETANEKQAEQPAKSLSKTPKKEKAFESPKKPSLKSQINEAITHSGDTTHPKGARNNKQRTKKEGASGKAPNSHSIDGTDHGHKNDKRINRDTKGNAASEPSTHTEGHVGNKDGSKESAAKKTSARRKAHRKRDDNLSAQPSSASSQEGNDGSSKPTAEVGVDNKGSDHSGSRAHHDHNGSTRRSSDRGNRRGRGGMRGGARRGRGGHKEDNTGAQANTTTGVS